MIGLLLAADGVSLLSGFLLMRRVPLCPMHQVTQLNSLSIVVPARDEEKNLACLLGSLRHALSEKQSVLVVDDHSTDKTAEIAVSLGASVLSSAPLPKKWTGKNWACAQGAAKSTGDTLLFLDADTWLEAGGLERIIAEYQRYSAGSVALSLLPYYETREPYEELSLFFYLLTAIGAGGFGVFAQPLLFGQSLLISRNLYRASGGHEAVCGNLLEHVAFAAKVRASGGQCVCLGGKGVLHVRMFPDGVRRLIASCTKAFADGAARSGVPVLTLAVFWLSALSTICLLLAVAPAGLRIPAAVLYLCAAAQVGWFSRQIGTFRWYTAAIYPIPLIFFFTLFTISLVNRIVGRRVAWRGRQV